MLLRFAFTYNFSILVHSFHAMSIFSWFLWKYKVLHFSFYKSNKNSLSLEWEKKCERKYLLIRNYWRNQRRSLCSSANLVLKLPSWIRTYIFHKQVFIFLNTRKLVLKNLNEDRKRQIESSVEKQTNRDYTLNNFCVRVEVRIRCCKNRDIKCRLPLYIIEIKYMKKFDSWGKEREICKKLKSERKN